MNIKKFNIEIHQILFGLLITSGFPGITYHSVFFESFNPDIKFKLYILSLFLREFFTFLLGLKMILILLKKISIRKIKYLTFIAFLPLIPIILLVFYDFNAVLFFTGIRFYILFSVPLFIFENNGNLNFKRNIKINDFIFYCYLVLNILSFTIGYEGFTRSGYGETFLGVRYMFIFDNPVIASQQFGIFLIYTNFRMIIEKSNFEKTKFLIISFLLMFLVLYTGGRAGLVVAFITGISSIIIYFFPQLKYIFLTQKRIKNKFFIVATLFGFAIFSLILFSNTSLSGRAKTQSLIEEKGIFGGTYGNRLGILNSYIKEKKIEDIIFGKPGKGTNTACNPVISDYRSEECQKTDSLASSSIYSFGIIGFLLYLVILIVVTNSSYSPLMTMAFLVYSLSQIFPEIILPWTQFVLILFHSNQLGKINKLKKSKL